MSEDAPVTACPCGGPAKGACAAYLEQNLYDREARWAEWGSRPATFAQRLAMQSISTREFPGMPPAAAIVVRTPGSEPKRPRKTSFMPL